MLTSWSLGPKNGLKKLTESVMQAECMLLLVDLNSASNCSSDRSTSFLSSSKLSEGVAISIENSLSRGQCTDCLSTDEGWKIVLGVTCLQAIPNQMKVNLRPE
jgi:hypothetical protein